MDARHSRLRASFALIAAWIFSSLFAAAAQPGRIHGPIDRHRTVVLKGHLNWRTQASTGDVWTDRGALEAGTLIHDVRLVLQPSEEQAAELG